MPNERGGPPRSSAEIQTLVSSTKRGGSRLLMTDS
jgi:hypothetical protein